MTNQSGITSTTGTTGSESLTGTASDVTTHAGEQARQVVGEAGQQAREVATEVKEHAADLLDQTRGQARQQADEGTRRVGQGLHSLSNQIQALREGRTQDAGPVANYAEEARRRIEGVADRLERGGVDGLASDLAGFARRRPGLFLVSCAGAGFALARLVRAGANGSNGASAPSTSSMSPAGVSGTAPGRLGSATGGLGTEAQLPPATAGLELP